MEIHFWTKATLVSLIMSATMTELTLASTLDMAKFHAIKGYIVPMPGQTFLAKLETSSDIACALRCTGTCSFAEYFKDSGTCHLYHWKDVKTVQVLHNSASTAADLFVGSDAKNIYLSSTDGLYAFDLTEGEECCRRVGGRLGQSMTDLSVARDQGWELCACGWFDDGYGYFLVSVASTSCGTTSLNRCTASGPFGAHCIIE